MSLSVLARRQHHHLRPRGRGSAVDALPQLGAEPRRRRMPRHVGGARRDAGRRIRTGPHCASDWNRSASATRFRDPAPRSQTRHHDRRPGCVARRARGSRPSPELLLLAPEAVGRHRLHRPSRVDIDPGLLAELDGRGRMVVAPHHCWFTIGETVGTPSARSPDCGLSWLYTPASGPPALVAGCRAPPGDAFTMVTHWWRAGSPSKARVPERQAHIVPGVRRRSTADGVPLELATNLDDEDDRVLLGKITGWRLRDSAALQLASHYRAYIRGRAASSRARSRRACGCRTRGSATGRSATSRADGPPSCSTPGRAASCRRRGSPAFPTPAEATDALRRVDDYDRHPRGRGRASSRPSTAAWWRSCSSAVADVTRQRNRGHDDAPHRRAGPP